MEKKNKINKKFLIPLFIVFGIGLIIATGYVVSNFSAKVSVNEPFTVSYALLGDAGNPSWNVETCDVVPSESYVNFAGLEQPVDFKYIYAGENRELCIKIDNKAEVPIGYVVSGKVREGLENSEDCTLAFGEFEDLTGNVDAFSSVKDFKIVHISAESPVVQECIIDVSVSRTEKFPELE